MLPWPRHIRICPACAKKMLVDSQPNGGFALVKSQQSKAMHNRG